MNQLRSRRFRSLGERLILGWCLAALALGLVRLFPHLEFTLYDTRIFALRTLPERFYLLSESLGRYRGYNGLHRSICLVGDRGASAHQSFESALRGLRSAQVNSAIWVAPRGGRLPSDLRSRSADASWIVRVSSQTQWNVGVLQQAPLVFRPSLVDGKVREVYLALKDGKGGLVACLPLVLYARFLGLGDCSPQPTSSGLELAQRVISCSQDDIGLYLALMSYPSERRARSNMTEAVTSITDALEPIALSDMLALPQLYLGPRCRGRFYFLGDFSMSAQGDCSTPTGHFRDFQVAAMALDTLIQGPYLTWLSGGSYWCYWALTSSFLALWLLGAASLLVRGIRVLILYIAFYFVSLGFCATGQYLPTAWLFFYVLLLQMWVFGRKWLKTVHYLRRYGGSTAARMAQFGHTQLEQVPAQEQLASIVFVGLPSHLRQQELEDDPWLLEHRQIFSCLVAEVTHRFDGIVHDFQADYLMLGFGTHPGQQDLLHAHKAFQACCELIAARDFFQASWQPRSPEGARVQASLNTGMVAVGWVGTSKFKRSSAAIGDTTNVAARLLGTAKKLDLDLVVSHSAQLFLKDLARFEELPPVMLKGKSEPVAIYRLADLP